MSMERIRVAGIFASVVFLFSVLFYLQYSRVPPAAEQSSLLEEKNQTAPSLLVKKGGEQCDFFEGKWVWDETYPLYDSRDCPSIDGGFRCTENGRPDSLFAKWRWQPDNCDLPRFDAKGILERLRGRRVAFVGDSIGRNQWESLLCMLSSAVADKSSVYEINGSPITKHNGFLSFMFKPYNCTVDYYRAPYLVSQGHPPHGSPPKVRSTLKLDLMASSSGRWRSADLIVLNTGHWWTYEKTLRSGNYFQVANQVITEITVEEAYQKSMETLLNWVKKQVNTRKTLVSLRTYAPVHFRSGTWKTGGSCHNESLPDLQRPEVAEHWASRVAREVMTQRGRRRSPVTIVDITRMTARRRDGHPSIYNLGPGRLARKNHQDCSHWCLPGVPDTWNELLFALFVQWDRKNRRH